MKTTVAAGCITSRKGRPDEQDGAGIRHENLAVVHSDGVEDVYRCLDCGLLFCVDLFESAQFGLRYTRLNNLELPARE